MTTLVADGLSPRLFREATAHQLEHALVSAGVNSAVAAACLRSTMGRRVVSRWPALAVEQLIVAGEPGIASVARFDALITKVEGLSIYVATEAARRAAAKKLGARSPGRPAPVLVEAHFPERPAGWSTTAWFTGGE